MSPPGRMRLPFALLLLLATALAVSLVPAGLALDRRVTAVLRSVAVEDLGRAPMIVDDRNAARAEALTMHAMTVATSEGVADAVEQGRLADAAEMAGAAAAMYGEAPVVVGPDGQSIVGPTVPAPVVGALRRGDHPVVFVYEGGVPSSMALVSFETDADWRGAAGSSVSLDESLVTTLAGLARSDVTLVGADGAFVASTLSPDSAVALATAAVSGAGRSVSEKVIEVTLVDGTDVWMAMATLEGAATILFSRPVAEELAALPGIRRSALLAGLLTLVLALAVGSFFALSLTRPVTALASAAGRVAQGDFDAPVPSSRVEELDRLASAFRSMRERLQARLGDLADANRELEDRQRRLHDLQAELIRQDRLSSSARMVAELAHEIRNPVANVRNCLEVVRRGLPPDSEGIRFADLAIDELLRMHELAEHLLDLNRPAAHDAGDCDPLEVVAQVATLAGVGDPAVEVVVVNGDQVPPAAIPPDALKQILFNLVQNAREADEGGNPIEIVVTKGDGAVGIDVQDRGRGIEEEVLEHLFDPFFTTKDAVTGVGLGLFVAEGLARRYGGRMEGDNREDGPGARFRVVLPIAATASGGGGGGHSAGASAAGEDDT